MPEITILQEKLDQLDNDAQKLPLIHDILLKVFRDQPDLGLKYGQLLLEKARALNHDAYAARALIKLANLNANRNQLEKAFGYMSEARVICEAQDGVTSEYLEYLNYMSLLYIETDDVFKAKEYSEKAFKVVEPISEGFVLERINTLRVKAIIEYIELRLVNGIFYCYEALKLLQNRNEAYEKASVMNILALIYWKQGNNDKAIETIEECLENIDYTHKMSIKAVFLNNVASLYNESNRYAEALKYLKEAMVVKKQLQNKGSMGLTYANIGDTYFALKQIENAVQFGTSEINLDQQLLVI